MPSKNCWQVRFVSVVVAGSLDRSPCTIGAGSGQSSFAFRSSSNSLRREGESSLTLLVSSDMTASCRSPSGRNILRGDCPFSICARSEAAAIRSRLPFQESGKRADGWIPKQIDDRTAHAECFLEPDVQPDQKQRVAP